MKNVLTSATGIVSVFVSLSLFAWTQQPLPQQSIPNATPTLYVPTLNPMDGLYVTPVPNAPFSATVEIVSHYLAPNGKDHVTSTINRIARSSTGSIYNERRRFVSGMVKHDPSLIAYHVYDPVTRQNRFINPGLRRIQQDISPGPPLLTPASLASAKRSALFKLTDLGMQTVDGLELHGYRWSRKAPAAVRGAADVTIDEDYWYSEALSIYMIVRRNDPCEGEQVLRVVDLQRTEPPADAFSIPKHYRVQEVPPTQSFQ